MSRAQNGHIIISKTQYTILKRNNPLQFKKSQSKAMIKSFPKIKKTIVKIYVEKKKQFFKVLYEAIED